MIRTVLIDDEALAIRRLEIKLSSHTDINIVGAARDGNSALDLIREKRPDLALVDINMPGMDGLSVAEGVVESGTHVIFVTAFHQYAIQAFERNAVDYLLKPVSTNRLDMALEKVRIRLSQEQASGEIDELKSVIAQIRAAGDNPDIAEAPQYFWTKINNMSHRINLARIEHIEAARDYVYLHMFDGRSHFIRHTMTALEGKLNTALFARVHRSAIVNLSRVVRTSYDNGAFCLHMQNGGVVRVGRVYKPDVTLRLKELTQTA